MARLTKSELENHLLRGDQLEWNDAARKKQKLKLSTAKTRRLFKFILDSNVRKPTELSEEFVGGLACALKSDTDPADEISTDEASSKLSSWRLHSIESEGLGGVNIFGGPTFTHDFEGESWLAEGPNGSGKSSLLGAIVWAMTGTRPRDFGEVSADDYRPVYSASGDDPAEKKIGDWPPFAAFPDRAKDLTVDPTVSVKLNFHDGEGNSSTVTRTLQDRKASGRRSPNFNVPQILIEAGLLMPARLAMMKFGEGGNQLAVSVQRLTGLDDLIAVGLLCEGLCNKAREYLSYRKKEFGTSRDDFESALAEVKFELKKIDRKLHEYEVKDTDDENGGLAALGRELNEKSAHLTEVISGDLSPDLDLTLPANQQAVAAAIIAATQDVNAGLSALECWKTLELVLGEADDGVVESLDAALARAKKEASEALAIFQQNQNDSRFQLKALAASWHSTHAEGDIDNCPLCTMTIQGDLKEELTLLRSAGEVASRTFADSERAILHSLHNSLPDKLRDLKLQDVEGFSGDRIRSELAVRFADNPKYSDKLVKFRSLVNSALESVPRAKLEPAVTAEFDPKLAGIYGKIEFIQHLVRLRNCFKIARGDWVKWWNDLVESSAQNDQVDLGNAPAYLSSENWMSHLSRLSEALEKAEPYRLGAGALRRAWKSGRNARQIEVELEVRQDVADAIAPLKLLGSLAESEVRTAIDGLAERMQSILNKTLISDRVQFETAKFSKKEGVTVRASVSQNLLVDASLIVNVSWMRAVLWAFIFALREEAVEQIGNDQFPVIVLDDPQATFDDQHRHRWSQQIASLQNGPGNVQIIMATHDHNFVDLIRYSGVVGRSALLSAAGPDVGHLSIFDGEKLEKLWATADAGRSNEDGRNYMSAARVQVETVLQIMLRGEEAGVAVVGDGFVIGKCRDKLEWLHGRGKPPWEKYSIQNLVKHLQKDLPAIKHLEMSHHASGVHLGMAEATDVRSHLRSKLLPALVEGFRTQREHFRLHGGLTQLYVSAEVLPLPEGYKAEVRKIPFRVLGRAAALTNGRMADGRLDIAEYDEASSKRIVLAQHVAYRLHSATLEPVARPGDILIVSESVQPTPNSFVVAATDEQLYARRLEFAQNHPDVAVLIAQANNPRKIAPPVIAQRSTFELKKVIGVVYDESGPPDVSSENEVGEIGGASALSHHLSGQLGLVEIVGDSAEPMALNKQYIIVKEPVSIETSLVRLAGRPIIAEDADGQRYFKRLQIVEGGLVVLESLDASGEHEPLVMYLKQGNSSAKNFLIRVWPVAGILFEIPT